MVSVPNLYPCNVYVYCTWWTSTCIRCTLSNNVAKVSLRLEGGSRVEVRSWVRRYRSISSIFSNSNLTQNGTVEKLPMKALKYISNGNTRIKLRSGGSGSRGIELVTLGSGFLACKYKNMLIILCQILLVSWNGLYLCQLNTTCLGNRLNGSYLSQSSTNYLLSMLHRLCHVNLLING